MKGIDVSHCEACPFCECDPDWRADYPDMYPDAAVFYCQHPELKDHRLPSAYDGKHYVVTGPPPEECPLRLEDVLIKLEKGLR